MNAKTLIDNLHRRGVRLRIDGEGLRWFGPVGVMTETDLSTLRRHKAELLAALAASDPDAFEERAGIIHEAHTIKRRAEQIPDFDDPDFLAKLKDRIGTGIYVRT